jgi:hypothetical protein
MKIILISIGVIICSSILCGCYNWKTTHEIVINAARDTTVILTLPNYESSSDAGDEYMGDYFVINSMSGYSDSKTSLQILDVHRERKYCMYNYQYEIDSGRIDKSGLWSDFYAGKAMIKFHHKKAKEGKIVLDIEF